MKIIHYENKYIDKDGCGKVAFYFNSEPNHGNTIPAEKVMYPDGTKPRPSDAFKCGSCKRIFDNIVLEHVEKNQ